MISHQAVAIAGGLLQGIAGRHGNNRHHGEYFGALAHDSLHGKRHCCIRFIVVWTFEDV